MKKAVFCIVLAVVMFAAACGKKFTEEDLEVINRNLKVAANALSNRAGVDSDYFFDENKSEANLYVSIGAKEIVAVAVSQSTWNGLKEGGAGVSEQVKEALSKYGVEYVTVYIVEEINYSHEYSRDEILLVVRNGSITYDFHNE